MAVTRFLLDVNLLLALSDAQHVHHGPAHEWWARKGSKAWATCPITENGFVRVAAHPSYPSQPGTAPEVLAILRRFCEHKAHRFWPDEVSLREALPVGKVFGHQVLTDLYLLALCIHQGGKLATFDRKIPATILSGGEQALELLSA